MHQEGGEVLMNRWTGRLGVCHAARKGNLATGHRQQVRWTIRLRISESKTRHGAQSHSQAAS